jgi:hypothetical protein
MSHLFSMSAPVVRHKRKQAPVVVDDEENDDPGTQDSPVCLEQEEIREKDTITPARGCEESRQAIAESLLTECEERYFSAMASATQYQPFKISNCTNTEIEEYVVTSLRARAFGRVRSRMGRSRARRPSQAEPTPHLLLPQPVERFSNIIPAFVDRAYCHSTEAPGLARHLRCHVSSLRTAPYIDILVIRPCTFVKFQILVLHAIVCAQLCRAHFSTA